MPVDARTFDRKIRKFVADGSGIDAGLVIEGNSKGGRPKEHHASVLLIGDRRVGYPAFKQGTEAEGVASVTPRRAEYSVQFWRDGAVDSARAFASWAEDLPGLEAAVDGEFRVVFPPEGLDVQRLDGIVDDNYEERTMIDLVIEYFDERRRTGDWADDLRGTTVADDGSAHRERSFEHVP